MNKELLENQWTQVREIIREKWSNLTDEDLREINGRYDQLIARLQQRYGFSKEQAEEEVRRFTFDKTARNQAQVGSQPISAEGGSDRSSLLRTILFVGIPLLLLGYYLATSTASTTTERNAAAPVRTQEVIVVEEGPVDFLTSQNIFGALISQNFTPRDLANIKVTTSNGVVTLSGTVSTNQQRDLIQRIAQNTPGVSRVNNQILVK